MAVNFYVVLFCLFSYCVQTFDIVSASSQLFHYGRIESGGGISLEVVLVAQKSSEKLSFDNITYNGHELQLKIFNMQNEFIEEFYEGDTLLLNSTLILSSSEISHTKAFPSEDIILHYRYKKKEKNTKAKLVIKKEVYFP